MISHVITAMIAWFVTDASRINNFLKVNPPKREGQL